LKSSAQIARKFAYRLRSRIQPGIVIFVILILFNFNFSFLLIQLILIHLIAIISTHRHRPCTSINSILVFLRIIHPSLPFSTRARGRRVWYIALLGGWGFTGRAEEVVEERHRARRWLRWWGGDVCCLLSMVDWLYGKVSRMNAMSCVSGSCMPMVVALSLLSRDRMRQVVGACSRMEVCICGAQEQQRHQELLLWYLCGTAQQWMSLTG